MKRDHRAEPAPHTPEPFEDEEDDFFEEDETDWSNPTAEEQAAVMDLFKSVVQRIRPDVLPRPVPKMEAGRNEPCPCGSGKKFKRCHGAAAE